MTHEKPVDGKILVNVGISAITDNVCFSSKNKYIHEKKTSTTAAF